MWNILNDNKNDRGIIITLREDEKKTVRTLQKFLDTIKLYKDFVSIIDKRNYIEEATLEVEQITGENIPRQKGIIEFVNEGDPKSILYSGHAGLHFTEWDKRFEKL